MIESAELRRLLTSIRNVYGYDFTDYAEASVIRRVTHFMRANKIGTIQGLDEVLLRNETMFAHFVQEFTVNVTEMFRDPSFYKSLREHVLKHLATYPIIKIWIAGCSTGEEVYSIAILLKEEGLLNRAVIYATDINQRALQVAKEGIYRMELMKSYTINYQKAGGKKTFSDYYAAKYDAVMMDKSLRNNIVFSLHNLAVDTSFNEFQLILCRNVLIYFNQRLQNKAINLFYDSLSPFGFLALGNKESLLFSDKIGNFATVDRHEKIYRKEDKKRVLIK